jgi:hypothetical protein
MVESECDFEASPRVTIDEFETFKGQWELSVRVCDEKEEKLNVVIGYGLYFDWPDRITTRLRFESYLIKVGGGLGINYNSNYDKLSQSERLKLAKLFEKAANMLEKEPELSTPFTYNPDEINSDFVFVNQDQPCCF